MVLGCNACAAHLLHCCLTICTPLVTAVRSVGCLDRVALKSTWTIRSDKQEKGASEFVIASRGMAILFFKTVAHTSEGLYSRGLGSENPHARVCVNHWRRSSMRPTLTAKCRVVPKVEVGETQVRQALSLRCDKPHLQRLRDCDYSCKHTGILSYLCTVTSRSPPSGLCFPRRLI